YINDPSPSYIYTLSLHDALPIYDTLNFNRGRDYPLKNIGTEENIKFRDAILDVKVYNAQKGKEYRIYRIMKNSDSYVDEGTQSADRKSTRLNSSHVSISYAVFCL